MTVQAVNETLRNIAGGDTNMPRQPATSGNSVELFVDPPAITEAMTRDVRASRLTNVTMWGLADNGGYGTALLDSLKGAAQVPGNEVNLMYDWIGTAPFQGFKSAKQVRDLRAAGVHTKPYMHGLDGLKPPGAYAFSYDHRKMAMMLTKDGPVGWIGGTNLARQFDDFHDMMVRVQGPAAAQIWTEILGRWTEQGGKLSELQKSELARAISNPEVRGPANVKLATNTPGGDLELTEQFFEHVKNAKERFWATTPSMWSESMINALKEADQRGVDVRVVVARDKARDPLLRQMTKSYFPELVDSGVQVYDSPRHLHGKLWMADRDVMVGSANLNFPSRFSDFESGIFTDDAALRADVEDVFQKLFAGADVIDAANSHTTQAKLWGMARRLLDVR